MSIPVIAISKIDGGYLISCGDEVAVRQTYEDLSFLIKKWLDDPPQRKHKETLADLFGYDPTKESPTQEALSWVEDELKKN